MNSDELSEIIFVDIEQYKSLQNDFFYLQQFVPLPMHSSFNADSLFQGLLNLRNRRRYHRERACEIILEVKLPEGVLSGIVREHRRRLQSGFR